MLRRRQILQGSAAMAATALWAPRLRADELQDGPAATDARPWLAYHARLLERLRDAGGGRFAPADERAVFELTNQARQAAGHTPLAWRDDLALTARAQAAEIAYRGELEHLSPEGFDPSHRYWLLSRRTIGSPSENIAFARAPTPPTPEHLMELWRNSPEHWLNLQRSSHTDAGFGLVRKGDEAWIVGLYARPAAVLPEPLPLRPTDRQVRRILGALPRALKAGVDTPQGAAFARGIAEVMQVTAQRRLRPDARQYDVIGGPVFFPPPGSAYRLQVHGGRA